MGAWGPAIFSDDTAADVRGTYVEKLEDGLSDDEALASTLAALGPALDDDEDGPTAIIALALTMWSKGRLTDEVREQALAAISRGPDDRWDEPKSRAARQAALTKAKAQLESDQPTRKRVTKPWAESTSLRPGDVLALRVNGQYTLLRVARVEETRYGVRPVVRTLDYSGSRLPTERELRKAKYLVIGTLKSRGRRRPRPTGAALSRARQKDPDFGDVGFAIVGHLKPRRGDRDVRATRYSSWESARDSIEAGGWFVPHTTYGG